MAASRPIDVLLIGAGRSGTTSMYYHLKDAPSLCWSRIKELHYFSLGSEFQKGEGHLERFFGDEGRGRLRCSSDTYLLAHPEAPERVYQHNPSVKVLVLLRHPVDRAYSSYYYGVHKGYHEDVGFMDHLEREREYCPYARDIVSFNNHCHFYGSLYHRHLSRWSRVFPSHRILVLRTRDLTADPEGFYTRIGRFLGIEGLSREVNTAQLTYNRGGEVRSRGMQQVLANRDHWVRRILRGPIQPFKWAIIRSGLMDRLKKANQGGEGYPELPPSVRREAWRFFSGDLERLARDYGISWPEE